MALSNYFDFNAQHRSNDISINFTTSEIAFPKSKNVFSLHTQGMAAKKIYCIFV